ncbi:MAG: helix-turn-helix transcriptional regulator [Deltaproteobacteria bacterium]|nr:helix-turn-helix transcriptional regulator [Deltaproteobacteria bacterium]
MPRRASPCARSPDAPSPPRRRAPAGEGKARRRAGSSRDRDATVAAIVAAATELMAKKGPDGFGLAELGDRAGVSFGLIHRYFGGKAGLLKETLRQPFARQLARVLDLYTGVEATRSPGPLVSLLFSAQARAPHYVRLIAWGILTELLTEDVFATHRESMTHLLDGYRRDLAAARAADVDARAVAALMLTATLGFQLFRPMLESLLETGADFEPIYRRHLEMALESFRQSRRRARER